MKANVAEKHPGTPPTALASPSPTEGGAGVPPFPPLPAELADFLEFIYELNAPSTSSGVPEWAEVDEGAFREFLARIGATGGARRK